MADFNLQRFRVLLVEDNGYVCQILKELLYDLSVGQVQTANSGVEAIEIMKSANTDYGEGGPFDLIISDMMMTPIDGLLLLKWVREGKESPDRFVSFLMMSGAADDDNVKLARDKGVNEFLAKPFSASTVAEKVLALINRPRQFVATRDYFGPDRQRRRLMFDDTEDRRMLTEKDATVVYSSRKVVRPKQEGEVYLFRLPNRLLEKAGGLSGKPGVIPLGLLKEADNKLDRSATEFHDWALDYLRSLSRLCVVAAKAPETKRRKPFEHINLIAHELRGQGGTFGYPLITDVGKMLYQITGLGCPTNDTAIEIVKAHIDTMRVVFRDKVTGDGGELGRDLMEALNQAIARIRLGVDDMVVDTADDETSARDDSSTGMARPHESVRDKIVGPK